MTSRSESLETALFYKWRIELRLIHETGAFERYHYIVEISFQHRTAYNSDDIIMISSFFWKMVEWCIDNKSPCIEADESMYGFFFEDEEAAHKFFDSIKQEFMLFRLALP